VPATSPQKPPVSGSACFLEETALPLGAAFLPLILQHLIELADHRHDASPLSVDMVPVGLGGCERRETRKPAVDDVELPRLKSHENGLLVHWSRSL
jgi:hypothetical protein